MANALFRSFKARALSATTTYISGPTVADLDTASETFIKCALTDNAITNVNEDTHEDWADISTAAWTTQPLLAQLTIATSSGAVIKWDADDVTFTAVNAGGPYEQVVIWNDSAGASSTDILIVKFDTATGLPVTQNGGNIVVQWNASGIFTW